VAQVNGLMKYCIQTKRIFFLQVSSITVSIIELNSQPIKGIGGYPVYSHSQKQFVMAITFQPTKLNEQIDKMTAKCRNVMSNNPKINAWKNKIRKRREAVSKACALAREKLLPGQSMAAVLCVVGIFIVTGAAAGAGLDCLLRGNEELLRMHSQYKRNNEELQYLNFMLKLCKYERAPLVKYCDLRQILQKMSSQENGEYSLFGYSTTVDTSTCVSQCFESGKQFVHSIAEHQGRHFLSPLTKSKFWRKSCGLGISIGVNETSVSLQKNNVATEFVCFAKVIGEIDIA